MPQTLKISETDLFQPVHGYFEKLGYEVHAEVKNCDLAATKGEDLVIVELKRSLNLELLIQAAKRQRITDQVYVAVPQPSYSIFSKKWRDLYFLVRRLELGLIIVSFKDEAPKAAVVLEPAPFDRGKSMQRGRKKQRGITHEINGRHGNYNVGGSAGVKLMTAYKENSIFIACCLAKCGPQSPRQLRAMGTGNKTLSILSKNFYGWFDRVAPGLYQLSVQGHEALPGYPELVGYYDELLNAELEKRLGKDGVSP